MPEPKPTHEKESLKQRFKHIIQTIFVENFDYLDGLVVNPINIDLIAPTKMQSRREKYKQELEYYQKIEAIIEVIHKKGGITQNLYKQHTQAINHFIRLWLGYTPVANGYDPKSEEITGQKPTREMVANYPEDGTFKDQNIFDYNRKAPTTDEDEENLFLHHEEGILWQKIFDEDGLLTKFRVFHQPHRSTLQVKTLDLENLYQEMENFIKHNKPAIEEISTDRFISKEKYLKLIEEFNQLTSLIQIKLGKGVESRYPNRCFAIDENVGDEAKQPWLVVHMPYAQLGRHISENLGGDLEPIIRGMDISIVEYRQDSIAGMPRVAVIYPYRNGSDFNADIEQNISVVSLYPREINKLIDALKVLI
jgi:hypothetical protein